MNSAFKNKFRRVGRTALLAVCWTLALAGLQAQISVDFSSTPPSCNGFSNGSITATATGGTAPYLYNWSNGNTSATLAGVAAGNYSLNVTDADGTTASFNTTLTQADPLVVNVMADGDDCEGTNGNFTAVVLGGAAPFSYQWNNGNTSASLNAPGANGYYSVTVTDANGCQQIAGRLIDAPLQLSTVVNNVLCAGDCDASINLTVTGGSAPFSVNWSNGGSGTVLAPLPPGTYTATVTDGNGCTATTTATVTEPPAIESNVSVSGNCTQSVSISTSATGGVGPYTYQWSTGETTPGLSNIAQGYYYLTITDANGCKQDETVIVSNGVTGGVMATGAGCAGGNVEVCVFTGEGPYTYQWSNGATTQIVSNVAAGDISVTVTDAAGCTGVFSGTVGSGNGQGLDVSITNVSQAGCDGTATGSATATVSSGTGPYTYAWSNGASSATISNLSAGTYTVTVTDATGCTGTETVTISAEGSLSIDLSVDNIDCGETSGTVMISNMTSNNPPVLFTWSTGQSGNIITVTTPGTYSVTATDAAGCTVVESATVEQTNDIDLVVASSSTECNGANTGTASAFPTSGTAPYTYVWSTGGSTQTIFNLGGGTYFVTVTDAQGCMGEGSVFVETKSNLSFDLSVDNIECNEAANSGSITATNIVSDNMPVTFVWSNGQGGTTIGGLTAGTYTVTATDAAGCTVVQSATIEQTNGNLSVTATSTPAGCDGSATGTATATASDGTAPYMYVWNTGQSGATITGLAAGTYTVTATDALGCTGVTSVGVGSGDLGATATSTAIACNANATATATATPIGGTAPYTYMWSTGEMTQSISGLNAGTYSVTIMDAAGCMATASTTVSSDIVDVTVTSTDSACNGVNNGTATATPVGGNAPYSYLWSNGATSAMITGLGAGQYSVTITDATQCTASGSTTVFEGGISATTSVTNSDCDDANNGSITANPTGGTAPYTYVWSNGGMTQTISNLGAGFYSVTVTDASGCQAFTGGTVLEGNLLATASGTNAGCNGATNGTAMANAMGGTAPYTYVWSTGGMTQTITGLAAGTYSVTVTDVNNCDATASVTIGAGNLFLSVSSTPDDCTTTPTGTASVTVVSGTAPYTYVWSTGDMTAAIGNLTGGEYSVTVTDATMCVATATVTVGTESNLSFNVSQTNIPCQGGFGSITISDIVTDNAPVSFSLNGGAATTNPVFTMLNAGTYVITGSDAAGCTFSSGPIEITQDPATSLDAALTATPDGCPSDASGSATITVTSGAGPFTYLWSNGGTTPTISGLTGGTYTVTVNDTDPCTITPAVFSVVVPSGDFSFELSTVQPGCDDDEDGSISIVNVLPAGTMADYYLFDTTMPGDSTLLTGNTTGNIDPGTYVIVGYSSDGCRFVSDNIVLEPAEGIVASIGIETDDCSGNSIPLTLTANTDSDDDDLTYTWILAGVGTLDGEVIMVDVATGSTLDVQLIVSGNNAACADTVSTTYTVEAFEFDFPSTLTSCLNEELSIGDLPDSLSYEISGDVIVGGTDTTGNPEFETDEEGDFMVTAIAFNAIGCSDTTMISVSITDSLTITPMMVETSQCDDFVVDFSLPGTSIGDVLYVFTDQDSILVAADEVASFDFGAAGTYTVNVVPQSSCALPTELTVDLLQVPSVGLDLTNTICSDSTILTFSNLSTADDAYPIDSIEFTLPDGTTVTDSDDVDVTFFENSTDESITLTIFYGNGCSRDTVLNFDVTVFDPEESTALDQFCGSEMVSLFPNADPDLMYEWSDNVPDDQDDLPDPMVLVTETTTFSVTITDADDCQSVREVTITIDEEFEVGIDGDDALCAPDDVTLTLTDLPDDAVIEWFVNGTPTATTPSITQFVDDATEFTAVVSLSNGSVCTDTVSTVVDLSPVNLVVIDTLISRCFGESVTVFELIDSSATTGTDLVFTYDPFDPTTVDLEEPVTVTITGTNPVTNCFDVVTVDIQVVDLSVELMVEAEPDTIPLGLPTTLRATVDPDWTYEWRVLGDTSVIDRNPTLTVMPEETTTYEVTVMDENGCPAVARLTVVVLNDPCDVPNVFLPNAFTPNGDGRNDVLRVRGVIVDEVHLIIFNRWGERIFESFDQGRGWDGSFNGEEQCTDVYGYYLEVRCFNGESYYQQGNVSLLR